MDRRGMILRRCYGGQEDRSWAGGEARAHLRRYAGAIPALHRPRSGKKGLARILGARRSCCGGCQGLEVRGVAGPWRRMEVCTAELGERARLGFVAAAGWLMGRRGSRGTFKGGRRGSRGGVPGVIPTEIAGGSCCATREAGKKGLTRGPGRSDTTRGARALAERGSGADKRGRLVSRGGRATKAWASWAVRWEVGAHGAEGAGSADRWVGRAGLSRALERRAGPGVRKWAARFGLPRLG